MCDFHASLFLFVAMMVPVIAAHISLANYFLCTYFVGKAAIRRQYQNSPETLLFTPFPNNNR